MKIKWIKLSIDEQTYIKLKEWKQDNETWQQYFEKILMLIERDANNPEVDIQPQCSMLQ